MYGLSRVRIWVFLWLSMQVLKWIRWQFLSSRCLTLLLPALGYLFSFGQKLLYVSEKPIPAIIPSQTIQFQNGVLSENCYLPPKTHWKSLAQFWTSDTLSLEEFLQYMYSNKTFQSQLKKQLLENCSLNDEYSSCRKKKWYSFLISVEYILSSFTAKEKASSLMNVACVFHFK